MKTLNAAQQQALAAAANHNSFSFFLDMRVGKTLTAIRFMQERQATASRASRILVSCPPEAVSSWLRELTEEDESFADVSNMGAAAGQFAAASKARWFIVNSQSLLPRSKQIADPLHLQHWDGAIVDESHGIANPRAKVTKLFIKHLSKAACKLCLSGLPAPEHDVQYVTQQLFLHGGCMGQKSFWHWRAANMHQAGFDWAFNRGARERLLAEVARTSIVISRKAAGMQQHPARRVVEVEPPAKAKAAIKRLREEWAVKVRGKDKWLDNGLELVTVEQAMADGFHPACPNKIKPLAVASLICNDFKGKRVVVWFNRNDAMIPVAEMLEQHGVSFTAVSGIICDKIEKRARLSAFEFGSVGPRVLLAQIASASTGCNLAGCDAAIFASHTWSRSKRAQAEDRIFDQRKRDPPVVIDVVAKGTVDEDCIEAQAGKRAGSKASLLLIAKKALQRLKKEQP